MQEALQEALQESLQRQPAAQWQLCCPWQPPAPPAWRPGSPGLVWSSERLQMAAWQRGACAAGQWAQRLQPWPCCWLATARAPLQPRPSTSPPLAPMLCSLLACAAAGHWQGAQRRACAAAECTWWTWLAVRSCTGLQLCSLLLGLVRQRCRALLQQRRRRLCCLAVVEGAQGAAQQAAAARAQLQLQQQQPAERRRAWASPALCTAWSWSCWRWRRGRALLLLLLPGGAV